MTEMPRRFEIAQRLDLCDRGRGPVAQKARESSKNAHYATLVGIEAWMRLAPAARRRFAGASRRGEATVYRGHITETRMSIAGRIAATLARVAGAPLPLDAGIFAEAEAPATVIVEDLPDGYGRTWTRIYSRPCRRDGTSRPPQVISSAKRHAGPTGLEEHLGHGIVMRLALSVENGALVFRSVGWCLTLGRMRITLPAFLAPGVCTITHRVDPRDPARAFWFELALEHPWFGMLVQQKALFRDEEVG